MAAGGGAAGGGRGAAAGMAAAAVWMAAMALTRRTMTTMTMVVVVTPGNVNEKLLDYIAINMLRHDEPTMKRYSLFTEMQSAEMLLKCARAPGWSG